MVHFFLFHQSKEYFSELYLFCVGRMACLPALQSLQQVLCTSFTISIFHTEYKNILFESFPLHDEAIL